MGMKFNNNGQKASFKGKDPLHWRIGKVPSFIGTGDNAKHSIATIVLIACFTIGVIISILVIANCWCFKDAENKVPDLVGDLRTIWEIVTPIITLVLGYEFGRHEK